MKLRAVWTFAGASVLALVAVAGPMPAMAAGGNTVLNAAAARKLLPPSVYYHGQVATTQLRNSCGIEFGNGNYLLAVLVDTSGYSTEVAAKYQAYFITETPIEFGKQHLPAGIYGVGFIAGSRFVVTDVGGHDLLTAPTAVDQVMKRPLPLQIQADPAGGFRLYEGRNYVRFRR
ncbi:MAG: hypothetical protein ACRD3N_12990 [Terracidiphilus sp.]